MPISQNESFRVVGYVTPSVDIEKIAFDKLTHINYAFLIPKDDGTLQPIPNPSKLEQIIMNAHEHSVEVLISVGGWGYDEAFETLADNPLFRATFVNTLSLFVDKYHLDGIDIDWEYPDKESSPNFLALMSELRTILPADATLTAAVSAYGVNGEGIPAASFQYMDFINVMVYDGIQHSTLSFVQTALDYWSARGLPKSKTILGVPFYSRPIAFPYRLIVEYDPEAAYNDKIEYQGSTLTYNGIPTIQLKTRVAIKRASGIMIWNLEYDTFDESTSLLSAIYRTIQESR